MAGWALVHILIIGGAGVLGSAVSPYLQAAGHRITVLGPDAPTVPGVGHVAGDATSFEDLAIAMTGVDAVVNFALRAARGPGADEQTEPVRRAFAVNVGSVYAQLRCASAAGVSAFVQISTMAVMHRYGSKQRSALEPADGVGLYAVSKRSAELACEAESVRNPDLAVTALRLAYPTRAEWWPAWGSPVDVEPGRVPGLGGREFAALHPEDLAAAIALAAARRGPYLCAAVTADVEGIALSDQWPHPLGWQPQHVLG